MEKESRVFLFSFFGPSHYFKYLIPSAHDCSFVERPRRKISVARLLTPLVPCPYPAVPRPDSSMRCLPACFRRRQSPPSLVAPVSDKFRPSRKCKTRGEGHPPTRTLAGLTQRDRFFVVGFKGRYFRTQVSADGRGRRRANPRPGPPGSLSPWALIDKAPGRAKGGPRGVSNRALISGLQRHRGN